MVVPLSDSSKDWRHVAIEAAKVGGDVLQEFFGKVDPILIEAKKENDWVSAADRASESAIIEFLRREAPGHGIFTEEAGFIPPSKDYSAYCWIIDPLDGTTNFLRGFPLWAVSVALEYRPDLESKWGDIIAGAVAIPRTNEMYSAAKGRGSFLNDVPFTIGSGHDLRQSLLGTGFPFRVPQLLDQHIEIFRKLLANCADIRRPGAAAADLCYTAKGIYDGFWEFDLYPWDIAAGSLIIREAGGIVSHLTGQVDCLTTGDILASNPRIYEAMLKVTQEVLGASEPRRSVDKSPQR